MGYEVREGEAGCRPDFTLTVLKRGHKIGCLEGPSGYLRGDACPPGTMRQVMNSPATEVVARQGSEGAAALRIGIDVGGVFAKIVVLDGEGRVVARESRRHHGNPVAVVGEALQRFDLGGPVAVGVTGKYAHLVTSGFAVTPVNHVSAEIAAVRRVFPEVRNIINVGGSSVTLIALDEKGRFLDYSTNSLCAAGTGSFLDQQADRLGLTYERLSEVRHHPSPPPIATRCSVFAKSDLIHRQQEGYGKDALWCGLCKSMTGTFLNTLLRGRPLNGLTVVTGGVSQNAEVMRWLKARYGDQVCTFDDAPYSGAIGAAHLTNGQVSDMRATIEALRERTGGAGQAPRRERLEFRKTRYPSFEVAEAYVDEHQNEVRVTTWPEAGEVSCYIGVDVGSTSTKILLMDEEERVLADVYRRTAGDPIGATKLLFLAVQELAARKRTRLRVLGAGTTGSGRKLVGRVIGADLIVNEISAHLAGAMHVDPKVDTIFEIGGQDSKYIHARNGRIYDSNMNYVCAAGTGSFVEEQAKKLGFALEEVGDIVMGIAPPVTSDRCTVFMEQDVDRLIRQGFTREECMAAVLCSVVKNYFTKVVGRRHVSRDRIFFQGATARNKGLVAAFERLLDAEMVVSPYCHVMGSYGAALLTKRLMREEKRERSTFKGLDLSRRRITLRTERCALCQNHCQITFADIEGESESPSWGYMCGRDPDSAQVRVRKEFEPFRRRERLLFRKRVEIRGTVRGTIGLPRCLTTFSFYPLWQAFFAELGYELLLSPRTDEEIVRAGNELSAADFCYPVKLFHGHASALAGRDDVDFLFLPHMISQEPNPRTTNSYFCPYVQAVPSVVRSALKMRGVDSARLLTPVVDFSLRPAGTLKELARALCGPLGVTPRAIRRAWRRARAAQQTFESERRAEGERLLREIEARDEKAVVIIGRPYNTLDLGANIALPQKIADLGLTVVPMDMLPYDIERLNPAWRNMYWSYGQHILAAAEFIRQHPNLYGIYFSNFSCGPDSFLLSFVEEIMGEKPFLTLELDEHGGDAGYLTRVEAFQDVIRSCPTRCLGQFSVPVPAVGPRERKERRVWIPNMHPIGGPLYAGAFRADGYDAEPLPEETRETFDLGRSLTRGSECLPTACTTGAFVATLRRLGLPPERQMLFMPTADGPCRFGQYATLQRLIFNRIGLGDVAILSPSSCDSYMGLSQSLRLRLWHAILAADLLLKAVCKVRPYEREPGTTDRVAAEEIVRLAALLERREDIRAPFREAIQRLAEVRVERPGSRPLVGIVGEIYVRCNAYSNDRLIRWIERLGGEAWLSPISEWILYTTALHRWCAMKRPLRLGDLFLAWAKNRIISDLEHRYVELARPFLADRVEPAIERILAAGEEYVPMNFLGEAILTLGRARLFAEQGAALVVNVAPFGCMPGTITSALCRQIQAETHVPIVSLFYDGEEGINQVLEVFLSGLAGRRLEEAAAPA